MAAPNPWLTAPVPLIPTCGGESVEPLRVYLALHISTGFSPLHSSATMAPFESAYAFCTLTTIPHGPRRYSTKRWRNLFRDHPTRPSFLRASFGLSGTRRQHTPMTSRNGCTNGHIFMPRPSLATITSPHPRCFLPALPVLHWECTLPRCTRSPKFLPPPNSV